MPPIHIGGYWKGDTGLVLLPGNQPVNTLNPISLFIYPTFPIPQSLMSLNTIGGPIPKGDGREG
jgi:hypothetical protein